MRTLANVLSEVSRPEEVLPDKEYRILGVRWYAEGVWVKNTCKGSEIKAKKLFRVSAGDLIYNRLFAWKGSFAVIPQELEGFYVSNEFPAFRPKNDDANIRYVMMLLAQPAVWDLIERQSSGVASISRKRLKVPDFLSMEFPLPSAEKQTQLYQQYELIKAEHYDLLAEQRQATENVSALRQSILQLAVQGKLVKQDPKDLPASVLLKKIRAEKERLIKEGKIKKQKPLPPIDTDEMPYELPKGWEWVRMQDLSPKVHYGYTASADPNRQDVRLLRITDIQNDSVDWDTVPGCKINGNLVHEYGLANGDIVVARTGGTIGKSYLVSALHLAAVFASYLIRIIPSKHLNPSYLKLFLGSELYWNQLYEKSMGTGQPNVNGTSLKSLRVPLPPSTEQDRIVEKVNQLMALCDELEAKLKQSQSTAETLMGAVVNELSAA